MSDIALNIDAGSANFHDIIVQDGDLVMLTGKQAILQNILQRLRIFLGEWFLDNSIGLPYFTEILVKNPDQSKIDALFLNQIMGTPGVLEVTSYSFEPNFTNRGLTVSFEATTTDGEVDYAGLI